jgi:hypothetical protein
LGSYSIAATLPGTPTLSLLKSIIRNFRLEPPPRWRDVITPLLLRPAFLLSGSNSDFSGVVLVISSKVTLTFPRKDGDVGRYVFKANFYFLTLRVSSLPSVLFNELPMLVLCHLFSAFFNY